MSLVLFEGSSSSKVSAGDATFLSRDFGVAVRSVVELELLARRLYEPSSTKLETMAEEVLHKVLPKKKDLSNNWMNSSWVKSSWADELTEERKTCEYRQSIPFADS